LIQREGVPLENKIGIDRNTIDLNVYFFGLN